MGRRDFPSGLDLQQENEDWEMVNRERRVRSGHSHTAGWCVYSPEKAENTEVHCMSGVDKSRMIYHSAISFCSSIKSMVFMGFHVEQNDIEN
jgi:hypothetical protein